MASDRLKHLIAQQAAAGLSCAELARAHEYTYEGMRELLATPDLQQAVEREREVFVAAGTRAMFRFLMHLDQLVDAQLADAMDRNNPNNYKARTWILERVLPQQKDRSPAELNVNLGITQEVAIGLSTAIENINRVNETMPMGQVRLIAGKDALPKLSG